MQLTAHCSLAVSFRIYQISGLDRAYGGGFIRRARAIGIEPVLIPLHVPKANAIAERVVGTLRRECLNHLLIVNQRHLRSLLREYVAYYNHARPHQSFEQRAPVVRRSLLPPATRARVVGPSILCGLHHEYERLAA